MPPFPTWLEWLGNAPGPVERLCAAGPVLVEFVCAGDLHAVRTLPYVEAWHERYAEHGLTALGVNSPRFPYTADRGKLSAALEQLGISFPVALDTRYAAWRSYGCAGWPSLFLWSRGGALRWFHFGEGEYVATERAIQEELRSMDSSVSLPEPLRPLRASDEPDAMVVAPTEEVFPGGAIDVPWRGGRGPVEVEYAAGGAFASLDGEGEVRVRVDHGPERALEIPSPGLHALAEHEHHERHRISVAASAEVLIHSISFAAGIPEPS